MKTIEVTDEMHEALMTISKELNTQNHRCTAMPYVIQVSKKEEIAAYEGCGETFWFGSEGYKLETEADEDEVIKEYLFDKYGREYFEDRFHNLEDYEKESILEELDYSKLEVTERDDLTDFFFTDKGLRSYYGEGVNTYMTGTQNPELKTIMKFLCEISGGKLHR
jgi:hypothetical protein|tara:strand:+ start:23 stop:517 length:495 start_codon:yes stop_codon:yes gene_type:complete